MAYVLPTCTLSPASSTPPRGRPCVVSIPIVSSGTVAVVVTDVDIRATLPGKAMHVQPPDLHQSQTGAGSTPILPPTPVPVLSAGGSITAGTHSYKVTFVNTSGRESLPSEASAIITSTVGGAGDGTVTLGIPVGPTGTSARKIYRTDAGVTNGWKYMGVVSDNTTLTYSDTAADGSGVTPPSPYGVTVDAGTTKTLLATITPMLAGAIVLKCTVTFHRTDSAHDTNYPNSTSTDLTMVCTGATITPPVSCPDSSGNYA
jgi:hypothetical protein